MRKRLLVVVVLIACPPVTEKARIRQVGRSKLAQCLYSGGVEKDCLRENAAWCKSLGLEQTCGADEYWPRRR